jgi:hypothetical protein
MARKGSKIFQEYDEVIVLNNNKPQGLLLWWKLAKAVIDSWVISQIREELWELNDKETVGLVRWYKQGLKSDSISLSDLEKKLWII